MLSISLLGGLGVNPLIAAEAQPSSQLAPSLVPQLPPPNPGECTADGSQIWVGATATTPGYWSALRAGQQCATVGAYVPNVTVHAPTGGVPKPLVPGPMKMIQVGPFAIPYEAQSFTIHWSQALPTDWQDFINQEIQRDCSGCIFSSMQNSSNIPDLQKFLGPGMPAQFNQDFLVGAKYVISAGGFASAATITATQNLDLSNYNPIVLTQHPDTGDDYGIYMSLGLSNPVLPYDAATNPHIMNLTWQKVERSWYAAIWNFIKHLVAKIIQVAGEIVCGIACTPAATQAALKAALASKNPAVVAGAMVGDVIAVGLCSCPLPPLTQPPVLTTNFTPYIVVGLAVLLGFGALLYSRA